MPTCPTCGTFNQDENKYCTDCGHSFSGMTGQLSPHTVLEGRYIVVETLGRGGMGAVYKALDQRLKNMPVAIKEMSTQAVGMGNLQAAVAAFEKEAIILTRLEHHALPRITDFFTTGDGRWYLVMNYIEGQTLKDVITKRGPIPEDMVLDWARQLCKILDYLHSQKPPVIFRDLKPSNIMLTPEGTIKLIDFGIARHFQPGYSADTSAYGSPGYSPPEQHGERQTDARSDIYSLGVTLHHLLTGIAPSKNPFIFEPPGKYAQVSSQLEKVVMMSLALKPERRPTSARVVLAMLSSVSEGDDDSTKRLPLGEDTTVLDETMPADPPLAKGSLDEQKTFVLQDEPLGKPGRQENNKIAPPAIKNIKLLALIVGCLLVFLTSCWYGWSFYSDSKPDAQKQSRLENRQNTSTAANGADGQASISDRTDATNPSVAESDRKKAADRQQIQSLLNKWITTAEKRNINGHLACYADYLDTYFNQTSVTKDALYNDKQTMFTQYSSINMAIENIQIDFIDNNEAKATFLKKWDAKGQETFSGEETQELKLRKNNGEWEIYSEIELDIYWVIKNGKKIM